MTLIRENIKDLAALETRLDTVLETKLSGFIKATHLRREEVRSGLKFLALSVLLLLTSAGFLFMADQRLEGWQFNIVTAFALGWVTLILIIGRSLFQNIKLLAKEMSMALVPILTDVLDRPVIYTYAEDANPKAAHFFAASNLVTATPVETQWGDTYEFFNPVSMSVHELVLTRPKTAKQAEAQLFRGLFVTAQLTETHSGRTFVSTEGDEHGFAHRTFWSDVFESGAVKEVVLEGNDFERDLHVASTDPTVAREFLTPDVMNDIHDWWQEHELNFRMSVIGNRLYLLLPEETVRIQDGSISTRRTSVKRYAWSIAKPLWRAAVLVEDAA